ncbi:GNAT family N-acetyltransferase [Winogradskyella sp.]|uniref:GNAT family N-acetyltransferase n=1 Tax=Winogradskyella sp. TaxID=1883156 RepID=UPI003AB4ABC7
MIFDNIETKRLILRLITIADTQDFFELDSNPKVHLFLGNNPVKTIEQSEAMIANILQQYKTNGLGRLAIIEKSTNEFVGWAGLKLEEKLRKEFSYYDLGYRLKEQFWGKGYATEAASASLEYGFNTLKLEEIGAAADVNHIASNTILKKVGMQPSGTFEYEGDLCNWYIIKQ